jgi:hypothetical protein
MQMSDLMSKWALFKHLIKQDLKDRTGKDVSYEQVELVLAGKTTLGLNQGVIDRVLDKAGVTSLDIFVDYRLNIPSELKGPSNLGVLWFPQYWLRNAVIIPQLIAMKPFNAMTHSAFSAATGMPVVYGAHPLVKAVEGTLIHPGMNVAEVSTFIPYVN